MSGLTASLLRALLEAVDGWLRGDLGTAGWLARSVWLFLPVVGASSSVWLVRRLAPEASGSGVQEIEGALSSQRKVHWRRLLPVKLVGSILSLGGNLAMGREGPTVQVGGGLGAMVGDVLHRSEADRHALVASGAAAGLAAAFNAPLAGVLFVIEEMRPHFRYSFRSIQTVFVSAVSADAAARFALGQAPVLALPYLPSPPPLSLVGFCVLGLLIGGFGAVFTKGILWSLDTLQSRRAHLRSWAPIAVGLMIGIASLFSRDAVGGGYVVILHALDPRLTVSWLIALVLARFVITLTSYGTGAPGGVFTPMLALGMLLGLVFAHAGRALSVTVFPELGSFGIAGMAALFAATVRAPLTGVALAVEMTGNYDQMLALLVTCTVATITAELTGVPPLYRALLNYTLRRPSVGAG